MKSVNNLNNSAISKDDLKNVKGGLTVTGTTVVVETQIDITSGNNLLYCDRRRKLINL